MANNNIDEQLVKESLECPICKDFFEEPKQLLCGHTFCNPCIARLDKIPIPGSRCYEFDTHHYNLVFGVEFSIQCPQCREMCKIPPHGLNTNYVVKEMVDKFREVYVSAAIVSSPVMENNAGEKVICYECTRKTPLNEMFFCKDCLTQNKPTKRFFMCSLCVIKSHKLHDVVMGTELATAVEIERASKQIVNICESAYEQVHRMKLIEEGLTQEIGQNCKRLMHGMNHFEFLRQQCYDNDLLKSELEEKVEEAKCLEEHFTKACVQLNKTKEHAVLALRNIESFVNWSKFDKNRDTDCNQDLIDMHNCFDEPSTSARVQNFMNVSTLTSPTNSFVYNEIDRKRRNTRQRKPVRRLLNRTLNNSREVDTIEIEAYVLD